MRNVEPEYVIVCNQTKPQMNGLGYQPTLKTYSLSFLKIFLVLKPRIIFIKEPRETSCSSRQDQMQSPIQQ